MTTVDNFDVEHFISSDTYKIFLRENKIELSPKQKAKIIYRSYLSKKEKLEAFKKLSSLLHGEEELEEYLKIWVTYAETFAKQGSDEAENSVHNPGNFDLLKYQDADEYLDSIFADFPLCFGNGDIIRSAGGRWHGDCYGIIHIFPDRRKQISKLLSRGLNPDDEEFVEFMDADGHFSHDHMLVTELEFVELESVPVEQKRALDAASRLIQGMGSIDELQYEIIQMNKQKNS